MVTVLLSTTGALKWQYVAKIKGLITQFRIIKNLKIHLRVILQLGRC